MSNTNPVILVYRRTHYDDPDPTGTFGCHDCMGRVRGFKYDAVIGIGAKKAWRGCGGIEEKITWIGINPKKMLSGKRGPLVTFTQFKLWNTSGPLLVAQAPNLYDYMFIKGNIPRYAIISPNDGTLSDIYSELKGILDLASPSPSPRASISSSKCKNTKHKLFNNQYLKRGCS